LGSRAIDAQQRGQGHGEGRPAEPIDLAKRAHIHQPDADQEDERGQGGIGEPRDQAGGEQQHDQDDEGRR